MKFFLATLCIVLSAIAFTNAQIFGRGQTPSHGQVDRQSKISSE